MRPSYKKYVRGERERYSREGLNITYPKQRKQEIVYRERIKEIPKVVVREKIVYIDKPVEDEYVPVETHYAAPVSRALDTSTVTKSSAAVSVQEAIGSEEYPE